MMQVLLRSERKLGYDELIALERPWQNTFQSALSLGKPGEVDEKENWPELVVLASGSLVELPGIEPTPKML
jgi:hypothetical protein